jgi:hypothetical protein
MDEMQRLRMRLEKYQNLKLHLHRQYMLALHTSPEWLDYQKKISECEAEIKTFKDEHYSDFGVYTNNERQLSGRIDGRSVQRMAA